MVNIQTLRELDQYSEHREILRQIGNKTSEWAGIPMPIEGEDLIVDESYVYADFFKKEQVKREKQSDADDPIKIINRFWSLRHRREVVIYEDKTGIHHLYIPGAGSIDQQLRTMGCSLAWGIEQEATALQTLGTLIRHHPFKLYLMTGSFLETSKRSGITYMFRKLRPTVAMKFNYELDSVRILCTLCMHPIGYYADSWAGAMTPTDDVIAHLMLMRGDEHMYWRRCNQHAPARPESGL